MARALGCWKNPPRCPVCLCRNLSGTSISIGCPSNSSRGCPKEISVCAFTSTIRPSRLTTTIASGADSNSPRNFASAARSDSAERFCRDNNSIWVRWLSNRRTLEHPNDASTATIAAAGANEAAAQQAVQQARSRLAGSEANAQSAETAPQQVSSTRDRARAALADVQQKRAALEQAQLNLQYTKIVAPVSGQVNKTVVVGMNIGAGQELLTVVPLDEVWITANFKETQLKHMHTGQRAEIHVDSSGRTFKGHVDSIAGATGPLFSLLPPENATGNYVKIVQRIPVKIALDSGENGDHQLRPGMNVVPDVYLK